MGVSSIAQLVGALRCKSLLHEPGLATGGFGELSIQRRVNLVVETRHRREEVGLQFTYIGNQSQGISRVESDSELPNERKCKQDLLEAMSVRKIGDNSLTFLDIDAGSSTPRVAKNVVVGQLDAFGVTCSATGVAENVYIVCLWLFKSWCIRVAIPCSHHFLHR
jgi:hypothetical protein